MKKSTAHEPHGSFRFEPNPPNDTLPYKRASGELGVPSTVAKSRNRSAQRKISEGTGEHAGHLIATRFGAPGCTCNLSLQNPNMNSYTPKEHQDALGEGGSWLKLEDSWAELLEAGQKDDRRVRIKVEVEDRFRPGNTRPYKRNVQWWMKQGSGDWVLMPNNIIYPNFSSPQGRIKGGA
jgi:hypothetical protein